jgi:hypothetical protein
MVASSADVRQMYFLTINVLPYGILDSRSFGAGRLIYIAASEVIAWPIVRAVGLPRRGAACRVRRSPSQVSARGTPPASR